MVIGGRGGGLFREDGGGGGGGGGGGDFQTIKDTQQHANPVGLTLPRTETKGLRFTSMGMKISRLHGKTISKACHDTLSCVLLNPTFTPWNCPVCKVDPGMRKVQTCHLPYERSSEICSHNDNFTHPTFIPPPPPLPLQLNGKAEFLSDLK